MFGRTPVVLYAPQTRNVHETRIDNRAPVADDVRLLKEVREAAEKDIIKSIKLHGNEFSGEVQVMRNAADMSLNARGIFTLNGTEHVVEVHTKSSKDTPEDLVERLYEKIVERVSVQLLQSFMVDTMQGVRGLRYW